MGEFVPGDLVVRIGAAMYFANASYVKDRLLMYLNDIHEVQDVNYVVIEMTPVNSVDSTALHVIEDMVNDFRVRNIQVAFTSLSHLAEETMNKAQLIGHIRKEWFFERVHDAVIFCIQHQAALRAEATPRPTMNGK